MHKALVVMAAGLGSRYGGVKQVERLGPDGEILMEYAIFDAVRAGFDKIVVIIKPEMLADVKELFGDRVERGTGLTLRYAEQRARGTWKGGELPAARTKPLGTLHALLSAREYLDCPFAALNADDFYGAGAIFAVGAALDNLRDGTEAVMAAYRLRNTVSPYGSVTRGVCAVEGGYLKKVKETYQIKPFPDGSIRSGADEGEGEPLPVDAPVSMNLWGFHPEILEAMDRRFDRFLQNLDPADNKSECLLPTVVDEFISSGALRCRAMDTDDQWFGLTYPQDKPGVVEALEKLHAAGAYPPKLWQ